MATQRPDQRPQRGVRSEELGVYEMIWDCKFCGSTNLPAKTHKFCPNCGAAQDPASRRFPSDEDKRRVENYQPSGADVICKACGSLNAGNARFCIQCGASLEGAQAAATVADQVRGEGERFAAQAQRDLALERHQAEMRRVGVIKDEQPKPRTGLYLAIAVVAVLIVVGIIYVLTAQREATAVVTGHAWERIVYVEEFAPVPGSAWCDAVPFDAYGITSRREIRDYRQVPDGEDCQIRRVDNGDGTFREVRECVTRYRQEPIYDDRCYFTVNRWMDDRAVRAEGQALSPAPAWPAVTLNQCVTPGIGCEREGGRAENYYVLFRSDNLDFRCAFSQSQWQSMSIESVWKLRIGSITGVPDCDSLEPAR